MNSQPGSFNPLQRKNPTSNEQNFREDSRNNTTETQSPILTQTKPTVATTTPTPLAKENDWFLHDKRPDPTKATDHWSKPQFNELPPPPKLPSAPVLAPPTNSHSEEQRKPNDQGIFMNMIVVDCVLTLY